nr:glycosyltransferase family protein [Thermanaerovibrio acidaminovorans]
MILAVLQARVSSRRLPRKVIKEILGVPMILRQVERIKRSARVDQLVVATSLDASDDVLCDLCERSGLDVYRGSLNDVLDRFYRACLPYAPDHVVRLTGDCPLADPAVIDLVIDEHLKCGSQYTSNTLEPTFPDGLDVEVMAFSALRDAFEEATLPSEREHVTPFIYKHPDRYRLVNVRRKGDNLSHMRWTVDDERDFELVSKIYEALYPLRPDFSSEDVLRLLEAQQELKGINSGAVRNEGYLKSLEEDAQFLKQRGGYDA